MSQRRIDDNPEFAFHYQRIQSGRGARRLRGQLLLFGSGALASEVLTLVLMHFADIGPYLTTLIMLLVFTFATLVGGLSSLKRGYLPVSDEEVSQQRHRERQQLFRYAQGVTPWWYSRTTIIMLFVYSVILAGIGVLYFLFIFSYYHNEQIFNQILIMSGVLSFLFVGAGIYYFVEAVKRARIARQLVRISSRELSLRMNLGEGRGDDAM